ncbi:nitrogen fixation protein nifu [Mycoplasmopsis maculosa]|uniref:Nitrogen fixation protein nifu n=1 Tax=Mycoplasmopsis maculosa TaxID=114885 RepID=A0A449B4C8_9BACT|nr:iron-sulfur cluster assembly scaffold protein [Mycoplasmopsis maculosa]VEU75452.1 nitrogen fixation protein nifu [Mycoplasmopsis maculosa]
MKHYLNPKYKNENIKTKFIKHGESCADYLEFDFELQENVIKNLIFNGSGCAFFIASTDMLINKINGMTKNEAISFIQLYKRLLEGEKLIDEEYNKLGELVVFDNVHLHYNRLNCTLMLARPLLEDLNKNE